MTPEAAAYLSTAREDLQEAEMIAGLSLAKAAARSAYYAMFHAAEALIFDRTGRVAKTHTGVRSEFSRLLIDTAGADAELGRLLNKGYAYKVLADYGTGFQRVIEGAEARFVIDDAARFLARVSELLETPPHANG